MSRIPSETGDGTLRERVAVERLPPIFAGYEQEPEQMSAGAPGKVGLLELQFKAGGERTRLLPSYASGPNRVQRALHLDSALPGMAYAIIQSVSGGVLQGDRLGLAITVRDGANAHVTTQSATKLYRMERNYATQAVRIIVEPGGYLEYLPDYLIPYRGARFYQETQLVVAEDATLVYTEALAPGRAAAGEEFDYELLFFRMHAADLGGRRRFTDTMVLSPRHRHPRRLLGGHSNVATMYILTRQVAAKALADRLHGVVQEVCDVFGSASALPGNDGVVLRAVADDSGSIQAVLHHAWCAVRAELLGSGVPNIAAIKYGTQPKSRPQERNPKRARHEQLL